MIEMSGIHLPDIGKLGIHIATGVKDKRKVASSNMAENARFRALSSRLDNEKHERSRVLKKEERKMKRKQHNIDKRLHDIQRNKKQELSNACLDSNNNERGKLLPSISHPKVTNRTKDESKEEHKDVDRYSSSNCSPTSAVFPIQDDFLGLENRESRLTKKPKVFLPPIETDVEQNKTKHRSSTPFTKKSKKKRVLKRNRGISEKGSSEPKNSKLRVVTSPSTKKHETFISEVFVPSKKEAEVEASSSPAPAEDKETLQETRMTSRTEDDSTFLQMEIGSDLAVDGTNSSANPFNHLLVEAQRREAMHQNLEDAFRAIKTCRYIRTPSRKEREDYAE